MSSLVKLVMASLNKQTKAMSFPSSEHTSLSGRISAGKPIYTTRVSKEMGKYSEGDIVKTPFGLMLVNKVNRYSNISDHPHLNELSKDQVNTIKNYGKFDYIKLTKVKR